MKINIVVPMAGRGRRLSKLGIKPLIKIGDKPMIQWAIESLDIDGNFIFIIQSAHEEQLSPVLKELKPDCKIISLPKITRGAAETVLAAKELIDNDTPLITVNCDQYIEWDSQAFLNKARNTSGCILTYTMTEPNGSFCILDGEGHVSRVAEKEVISDVGTVGIYYFGSGSDFVWAANSMISKDIRVNDEFYILPVYNELIAAGKKPVIYHLPSNKRHVWRVGVLDELEDFKKDRL